MTDFSDKFKVLWDTKVKAQIEKCTPHYKTVSDMERGLYSTEEAKKLLQEIRSSGYKDTYGQYAIGSLVWAVEHALADGRPDLNFIQNFYMVHGCLNDEGYWTNVHNNDFSTEEAKNLIVLRDMINELHDLL